MFTLDVGYSLFRIYYACIISPLEECRCPVGQKGADGLVSNTGTKTTTETVEELKLECVCVFIWFDTETSKR